MMKALKAMSITVGDVRQAVEKNILRESLNAQSILVGNDFKFGAKRAGSVADFVAAGFDLIDFPQVDMESERVSSTRVRLALASGRLQEAGALLGRPYSISGKVVHGAQRGRACPHGPDRWLFGPAHGARWF
jgi:riboflavin kinase/FMN adenylyltransferase